MNILILKKLLEKVSGFIAGSLIAAISCIALWQVFTRYVLNSPSTDTEELLRYLMIWMGFFGAAYGFGGNKHLSLTLLESKLSGQKYKYLKIFQNLAVTVCLLFIMVIGGYQFSSSSVYQTSATLGISMSHVYLIIPLSGVVIFLLNIINLIQLLRPTAGSEQ